MIDKQAFDADWYLAAYADVAAAGIDPWEHFQRHGRAEGRLPRRLLSEAWEYHLWRDNAALMQPRLEALLTDESALAVERAYAAWALSRWHAWCERWHDVVRVLARFRDLDVAIPGHAGPWLMAVEAATRLNDFSQAWQLWQELIARFPENQDAALARSNLLAASARGLEPEQAGAVTAQRLQALNTLYASHRLAPLALRDSHAPLALDNLSADAAPAIDPARAPRVSVIVPVYNAAGTIATALHGLLAQTWPHLELLLVDDASTDDTLAVVKRLLERSPRPGLSVRVLRHERNQGTYAARNTALAAASGEFITVHDSDDWSHPQKLEYQAVALMQHRQAKACLSHWVRVTPALHFTHWFFEHGWIYRNISSLMFRREVRETLGYWDRVRVAADTEYHQRILSVYGEASVIDVLPHVPLAFGRQVETSLTQVSATHLATAFNGVRKHYADAARRWHAGMRQPEDLYLSASPEHRPFLAPASLCREVIEPRAVHPWDRIQQSSYWDAAWYVRTYPDLQVHSGDTLTHFAQFGADEGRDPGPDFTTSGYRQRYADVRESGINPLVHFLEAGQAQGREALPVFPGHQPENASRPTVLLCGHQAAAQVYGAERCLLDTARALDVLGWNVVVTLPAANNAEYLAALQEHTRAVAVFPYGWWCQGQPSCPHATAHFLRLLARYRIDAVHANTVVLDAPWQAARASGVPLLVHAHELPTHDTELCETLGADANAVGRRVLDLADAVIANSRCVAAFFESLATECRNGSAPPIHVVPNTLDMSALLQLPATGESSTLRVGMLSSNQAKKGLADFEAVATHLQAMAEAGTLACPVSCELYGPHTPEIDALLQRQAAGGVPENITFRGYVPSPEEALRELDVMLNLSSVQESFGRTVLEAMTAGRAAVCYDWGALPELVKDGETGFLAPLGETQCVAEYIARLAADPQLRLTMGQAARQRAVEDFKPRRYVEALRRAYLPLSYGDSQ